MNSSLGSPFSINAHLHAGELTIGGISAIDLVNQYGTPLFVVDKEDFITRANAWSQALTESFGERAGSVFYASKAFLATPILPWLLQAGVNLDVCTGGELAVARAGNFPPEKIEFHGNNKSEQEISEALDYGVGIIVCDSFFEIERVAKAAALRNIKQRVYLRLTPGIEAHTHEYIATAHEDVKFGFSITSGDAQKAAAMVEQNQYLSLAGVHCHIGSQIFLSDGYFAAIERVLQFIADHRDQYGHELESFNCGGGFGVAYLPEENSLIPHEILKAIAVKFLSLSAQHKLNKVKVSIEPGRAIVAPSTTTLYRVGTTKEVSLDSGANRRYVSVDGGMSDNIRPALYGASYLAVLANRISTSPTVNSRIVGKHCESGDIVIHEIQLPADVIPGDLLAIPVTGAYGRSMASNYNHVTKPAVIAVENGKSGVILRAENYQDLIALEGPGL